MTIKRLNVSLSTTGANGANKAWLSGGSGASSYPQTFSGITYGWTTNVSGVTVVDTSAIDASNFPATTAIASGTTHRIRIDRIAGTFAIKLVGLVPAGAFATTRLRVLDADETTVLYSQNTATNFAGPASDTQINTNGSGTTTIGAADAGTSITTTGTAFYVDVLSAGGFNARLGYIEWDDANAGGTPTVSTIAPTSGPIGTQITITGTNLAGTSAVSINGTACTSILNDSATQVRATIASGTTTGALALTATAGSVTGGPSFTVTAAPVFTSLTIVNPNTTYVLGALLAPITVTARDQFGNVWTGSLAECVVTSLTLPITVTGTLSVPFVGGVATFSNLTPTALPPTPTITGFAPSTGEVGSTTVLTGTGFTGATTVLLGAVPCTFVVNSDTQITVTIPAGA